MRVSLFIACFNDTLFPETGKAVVNVLERLGVEVDFPAEQTCCGQLLANTGYGLEAIPLVRRFVRVFGDAEAIVTPSGSCAAMVVEQYPRRAELAGEHALARDAAALIPRDTSSPRSSRASSARRTWGRTSRIASSTTRRAMPRG